MCFLVALIVNYGLLFTQSVLTIPDEQLPLQNCLFEVLT